MPKSGKRASRNLPFALLAVAMVMAGMTMARAYAEEPSSPQPPPSSPDEDADLTLKTLALDIATSSFYELVDWARSLGLPEGGQASELRQRLYEHYGVKAPAIAASGRVITIEKAGEAEYFKLDSDGSPIIRISGGVVLRLNDEEKGESHLLEADEIVYDRDHDAVNAKGSVHYRREKGTSVEEFRGETMSVSLSDWSGIFLDGKLSRNVSAEASPSSGSSSPSASRAFVFQADTIAKRTGDILVLDDAIVSSCSAEHPHYSVRARRLWLLGAKEWAVSNATISIGEVPILWLPFFYFPSEELVFHPVLGSRSREGRFVQTTSYLIGSKPAKKTSSILNMVAADSGEEKELRGLYLRTIPGTKAKTEGAASLKVLADVYSSLGAAVGLVGAFPKAGPFQNLNFSLGLGMSRSITSTSPYSPFFAAGNYESVWNTHGLLPFRYGASLSTTLKLGQLGLAIALPFYSDQYWDTDFNNRSEDMEWLKLGSSSTTTSSVSTRSSFSQSLSLSYSFQPKLLSPWVSSIDVSKLGASLSWLTKYNNKLDDVYVEEGFSSSAATKLATLDPARYFFYPNILKPLDLNLSLKGSLIPKTSSAAPKAEGEKTEAGSELQIKAPWDEGKEDKQTGEGSSGGKAQKPEASLRMPAIAPGFPSSGSSQSGFMSLDWSLNPTAYIETKYLADSASSSGSTYSGWTGPDEIDLGEYLYELYSYKISGSLQAALSLPEKLGSTSLGLTLTSQDQDRLTTSEQAAAFKTLIASYAKTDWQYKQTKLATSFKTSLSPFSNFWLLSPSSVSYSFEGFLYRYIYKSDDSAYSDYESAYMGWDSDSITTNSATLSLGLRTGAKTQTLGLTASYLPATEAYSGSLALAAGSKPLSAGFTLSGRASRSTSAGTSASNDFSYDPLSFGLTLTGPGEIKLSDTFTYDIANDYPKTNSASLAWGPLTASLQAKRSYLYYIEDGWQQAEDSEDFRVTQFAAAFKKSWKTGDKSPYAASMNLDASYTQSIVKFSESVLAFNLGLTFKLADALDLSFSSVSQNASAWRYWPWLFNEALAAASLSADDYFRNPFQDIAQGFYFWDSEVRTASLFKLKSLSVKLVRYLHDWDVSFSLTATPKLDTDADSLTYHKYILNPVFQFLLTWRDMSDVKASFSRDSSGDYSF